MEELSVRRKSFCFLSAEFLILFGIVLLASISYWRCLSFDFIYAWDDAIYVLQNPLAKSFSKESFFTIWSSSYFSNYHPLTMSLYGLVSFFFGNDPYYFHLLNVLIHVGNLLLFYFFDLIFLLSGR